MRPFCWLLEKRREKRGKLELFLSLFCFVFSECLKIFLSLIGMGFCWDRWRFPAFSDRPNRELKWVDFFLEFEVLDMEMFSFGFILL